MLTPTSSELTQVADELACFLQTSTTDIELPVIYNRYNQYEVRHYHYALPLGTLRLLNIVLYLPEPTNQADIETARKSAIKSALLWQKLCLQQNKNKVAATCYVLTIDIQLKNTADTKDVDAQTQRSITHSFGARYFMEELILDVSETPNILQVFSWQDWQTSLALLKTPCELWRFLSYHNVQLQHSLSSGKPSFDAERTLLTQFMHSAAMFSAAISVDNALVKYALQDKPNAALVTMSLAQKNTSATAQMYQQHMQQAAIVWAQLSMQMIEIASEKAGAVSTVQTNTQSFNQWQQQLLDESLFSRHELIRTLYRHPKQPSAMQQSGYVVHQHSYENLGRHYVLIFYGHADNAQQNKTVIRPNLQKIAQDVATRLPLAELHHVVVMGIDFIQDHDDTFFDIDLWIQPVIAMTQKERQLTKQLQSLSQQNKKQTSIEPKLEKKLPSLNLNLIIPARHKDS